MWDRKNKIFLSGGKIDVKNENELITAINEIKIMFCVELAKNINEVW